MTTAPPMSTPLPSLPADREQPPPPSTKELLQLVATVLALLTLLVLALGDYALGEYFRALGLTPEQAGVDKQTLLTRACPVLAVLAALFLPIVLPLGAAAGGYLIPARTRRLLSAHPAAWATGLGAGLGLVVLLPGNPDPFDSTMLASTVLFGVVLFGPGAYLLLRRGLPAAFVCLVAAVVGCLILGLHLGERAYSDGEALRTRGAPTLLSHVLGARPIAADAAWTDLDDTHHRERVVYLGDQNGMSVFLTCSGRSVERVPSAQVRLRISDPEGVHGSLCAR
ncbi:hypothetical protein [Kitasatospora sp. NPDC088134]|uniref:hypothetical protein n=1 Tax=Kitasatospora sp. NPDC088134 TaxID=3364071 RepID=UPI00382EFECC